MIQPPFLHPGDKIGITAPGRKVMHQDIEEAIRVFHAWGLEVVLAKNIFSNAHSYLAGTDDQRLSDFQLMLNDDSVKAIVCARGGYGSTRILDQLDFSSFLKSPKWIVGFSDVTAFHLILARHSVTSVHGIMPILFSKPGALESIESLRSVLFGMPQHFIVNAHEANRNGKGTGQLVGGNLSLILDSMGTPTEPDLDGKILVIEEIDEYLYKIDRMMVQLRRTGKLNNLRGLIVGHMTDVKDTTLKFGETINDIILNHSSPFQFPIAFHFPTGHECPNLAWIHGAHAQLEVTSNQSSLTYL